MVGPGTTYEDRFTRTTFLRTAADTDGRAHEQRVEYFPASPFPPAHLHPAQDERFVIEAGAMVFVVHGTAQVVGAGEEITIARKTPHRAKNASDTAPAVVRWETRPALRTGDFFYRAHLLGTDAGPIELALLAHEYRDVFRLCGPASHFVPLLAGVARLRRRPSPRD